MYFFIVFNFDFVGTLANATLFQAYLLDGLNRWNQDRGSAATTTSSSEPQTYSGLLRHTANSLGKTVFGKKMVPSYTAPHKYTGKQHMVLLILIEVLKFSTLALLPK